MTRNELVILFKQAMIKAGSKLESTSDYGPKTTAESEKYDFKIIADLKAELPNYNVGTATTKDPAWLAEARKLSGSRESDTAFNRFLSKFWAKVGLPNFTSIVGSKNAWCGLFVGAVLSISGYSVAGKGAAAKAWDSYGQKIDYKTNGIPHGAIVRINHSSNCSSAANNHVGLSEGDCTPEDVKSGSFNMLGGNQSDQVKISSFPVNDICSVSWPKEQPLPAKITASKNCKGKSTNTESTR